MEADNPEPNDKINAIVDDAHASACRLQGGASSLHLCAQMRTCVSSDTLNQPHWQQRAMSGKPGMRIEGPSVDDDIQSDWPTSGAWLYVPSPSPPRLLLLLRDV